MFNLDQAIAEWRRQMRAAGIKCPATLDELESHLRDDVERQMSSGLDAEMAFAAATRRIGDARRLKPEFDGKSGRTNRILGVLWLAGCSWSLSTVVRGLISPDPLPDPRDMPLVLLNGLIFLLYAAGVIGSIFLFFGANWGRRIIRMMALLMAIACIAQILNFRMPATWRVWCGIVAIFSLVSIKLLNSPPDSNRKPDRASA